MQEKRLCKAGPYVRLFPSLGFKPTRSCTAHDLISVSGGIQCTNCGALHTLTARKAPRP